MATSLASLTSDSLTDEARRALSSATLLWAVASVIVLLLALFGVSISHEQALPIVVLIAWLGAEIAARSPRRSHIAVCEGCSKVTSLPHGALRRFWPWKHCAACGSALHYTCTRKHLLSVFPHEKVDEDAELFCTRCGVRVPPATWTEAEFNSRFEELLARYPKENLAPLQWSILQRVLARIPADTPSTDGYWDVMYALAERRDAIPSLEGREVLLKILRRIDKFDPRGDWIDVEDELLQKKPSLSSTTVLANAFKLLEGTRINPELLAHVQSELATETQKQIDEIFGEGLL